MDDALVIGSGPNGLSAALTLAQAGWRSRPRNPTASRRCPLTPSKRRCPAMFTMSARFLPVHLQVSPALQQLRLHEVGLEWRSGVYESAHPAPDGTCAAIARDIDRAALSFGSDGDAWRWLAHWQSNMGQRLPNALLALPAVGPFLKLGVGNLFHFGMAGLSTAAGYARRHLAQAARRSFRGFPCTSISARTIFRAPPWASFSDCWRRAMAFKFPSAARARSPMRSYAAWNSAAASCNSARACSRSWCARAAQWLSAPTPATRFPRRRRSSRMSAPRPFTCACCPKRASPAGCGNRYANFSMAGGPSRWTGRSPGRSRGWRTRPANRPWSTRGTRSTI